MEKELKRIGKGFYLTAAASMVSLCSAFVYHMVLRRYTPVYFMLAAAVALTALCFGIICLAGRKKIMEILPVVNAVLMAFAMVYGFFMMTDQISWVATALEPFHTLYSFIAYEVIAALAWIMNIAASFTGIEKE